MPPRIFAIRDRLRQDVAAVLSPATIEVACKEAGHRWRERKLGPVETICLFLLQILLENTSCRQVVRLGGREFTDAAYCQARSRVALAVFLELVLRVASAVRGVSDGSRWRGRRGWVIDGTSVSMPDEPGLKAHFGQPSSQKPGSGFPVARMLARFQGSSGGSARGHDRSPRF